MSCNRLGGCGQIGKQEESSTKRHLLPLQVAADTQFSWLLSFDQSTIKILSIKGNWHIAPISSLSQFFKAARIIYISVRLDLLVSARAWAVFLANQPVWLFQLQLCRLLPVAASISVQPRCMWIPVHFGVHFGVHFAFF